MGLKNVKCQIDYILSEGFFEKFSLYFEPFHRNISENIIYFSRILILFFNIVVIIFLGISCGFCGSFVVCHSIVVPHKRIG